MRPDMDIVTGHPGELHPESSYVSLKALDTDRVVERIVGLVGKEPDDIYFQIMYLDKMISVNGELETNVIKKQHDEFNIYSSEL